MTTSTEAVKAALALADSRDNIQSRYEAISRLRSTECIGESETADQACVRVLAAEVRSIRAILSDASAVHLNMLRGTIAWTPENLRHVTGDDTVIAELLDEVRRLRAELASQPMIATETHVLPLRK